MSTPSAPSIPAITYTCLKCSTARQAEWTLRGGAIEFSRCKCGSREFKLSGAANGILSAACAQFSPAQAKKLDSSTTDIWESLCSVLDANRAKMGNGGFSSRICLKCEGQNHNPKTVPCTCPCHAAWELRRRIESEIIDDKPVPSTRTRATDDQDAFRALE